MTTQALSTPTMAPATDASAPSTSACASTERRSCGVVAPLLAANASVRRWRAALTANAGPTSNVVSSSSPTAMIAEVTACPSADWSS